MSAYRNLTAQIILIGLSSLGAQRAMAGSVTTWANFQTKLPPVGTNTTMSLGGGSHVDILFTLNLPGRPYTYTAGDFGTIGSTETGLGYSDLYYTTAFNGGGLYTVTLTNFVVGANSLKGLFFVGDANDTAGPLIFTATGGAVSSWTQAGNQFAIGFDTATYTFTPATGKLQPNGNDPDGGGIVLDLGSLSSYTQIKLSFGASTADGWRYGVGEVSSTSSATPEPATFGLLGLSLVGVGIKLYRKRN